MIDFVRRFAVEGHTLFLIYIVDFASAISSTIVNKYATWLSWYNILWFFLATSAVMKKFGCVGWNRESVGRIDIHSHTIELASNKTPFRQHCSKNWNIIKINCANDLSMEWHWDLLPNVHKLALVQVMAWHRPGDKPLSNPPMIKYYGWVTHRCISNVGYLCFRK